MLLLGIFVLTVALAELASSEGQETVLVLGGQGLAGSATLDALLHHQHKVAALNNGKNYYDYEEMFSSRITNIGCIRSSGIKNCFEFLEFVRGSPKVRAVVDFTSSDGDLMRDAVAAVADLHPAVYIFVSAAAIYDVTKDSEHPLKEEDGVRPDAGKRAAYAASNPFGDKMLSSEEVLLASGLPYVIVRSADLIGPRDTTYRWWQYQLWAEHFKTVNQGFPIPNELSGLPFSLASGEDVAQVVTKIIEKKKVNTVYNVAIEKTFTLPILLLDLCTHVNKDKECYADYTDSSEAYYLYPSNHQGTLSIEKAKTELNFEPSLWQSVLKTTVDFYTEAKALYTPERDTVLRRLNENVVPYLRLDPLTKEIYLEAGEIKKTLETFEQYSIPKEEL